ncbi:MULTISPECIES: hypothetical protein [unclassified Pseudomonas]|uniref:hypothetical protein n=1 Tax=unclassified Pseudomonas TaxID=196821 RepID=UPI002113E854|nr:MULTISPECIES: hypothetical protein [unclassified Pseudomonas]
MKVLVNGGLNLSELDGWWAEAYQPACGWAIGDDSPSDDVADAERLYSLLEEVVPTFYTRDTQGIPRGWVQRMRASMSQLGPQFSSNRMLLEYLDRFYQPAIQAFRCRSKDKAALAPALHAWQKAVTSGWDKIHFGTVDAKHDGDQLHISVPVYLGEIAPEWVREELYAALCDEHPAECLPMNSVGPIPGAIQGLSFPSRSLQRDLRIITPHGCAPGTQTPFCLRKMHLLHGNVEADSHSLERSQYRLPTKAFFNSPHKSLPALIPYLAFDLSST